MATHILVFVMILLWHGSHVLVFVMILCCHGYSCVSVCCDIQLRVVDEVVRGKVEDVRGVGEMGEMEDVRGEAGS